MAYTRYFLVFLLAFCFYAYPHILQATNSGDSFQEIYDHLDKERKIAHTFRLDRNGLIFEKRFGHCGSDYMIFSPDSRWLATCGKNFEAYILQAKNGKIRHRLKVSKSTNDIAFSPNGRLLATAAMDVDIWDIRKRKILHTLKGHDNPVFDMEFNRNGTLLATVGWDETLNLWSTKNGWHIWQTPLPRHYRRKPKDNVIAFSRDGKKIVYDNGKEMVFISVSSGKKLKTTKLHKYKVDDSVITVSPDARWIAAATLKSSIKIFNTSLGKAVKTLLGHQLWLYAQTFSQDSRYLLTSGADRKLIVWETNRWKIKKILGVGTKKDSWAAEIAISPNNRLVAVRYTNDVIRIWDLKMK